MNMNKLFAKVVLSAFVLGGVPVAAQAKVVMSETVLNDASGSYSKAFDVGQKFLDRLTLTIAVPTNGLFRWTISNEFTPDSPDIIPDIQGFHASAMSRGFGVNENSGGTIPWFNSWQGDVFLGGGLTDTLTIDFKLRGKAMADSVYTVSWETVSMVPEPETWAMMMIGAGLVSYQVRRKQRALNRQSMLA